MKTIQQNKDGSVTVTAPVMIPGVPDCDFGRGEPPLTKEQIEYFAKSYEEYGLNDHEHRFEFNGRVIGHPVESILLPHNTEVELLNGSMKSYPEGTWMLTSKITDPEAVQTALQGGYTGYSPTVKNRQVADRLYSALKSQTLTYDEFLGACKSFSGDGLIKDVVDPVVLSVSLTKRPCQHHSKFCKHNIVGENMSEKTTLDKIRDLVGSGDADEVSALKSQVDNLEENIDKKFEEMDSKFESNLKSMETTFKDTLKEALSEVGASKHQEDPEPGNNDDDPEPSNDPEPGNNDDDDTTNPEDDPENDDGGEEDVPPQRGASKSRPIHNGSGDEPPKSDKSTYVSMGRNPDGTAKRI